MQPNEKLRERREKGEVWFVKLLEGQCLALPTVFCSLSLGSITLSFHLWCSMQAALALVGAVDCSSVLHINCCVSVFQQSQKPLEVEHLSHLLTGLVEFWCLQKDRGE